MCDTGYFFDYRSGICVKCPDYVICVSGRDTNEKDPGLFPPNGATRSKMLTFPGFSIQRYISALGIEKQSIVDHVTRRYSERQSSSGRQLQTNAVEQLSVTDGTPTGIALSHSDLLRLTDPEFDHWLDPEFEVNLEFSYEDVSEGIPQKSRGNQSKESNIFPKPRVKVRRDLKSGSTYKGLLNEEVAERQLNLLHGVLEVLSRLEGEEKRLCSDIILEERPYQTEPGYFALRSDPLSVWKCRSTEMCPGGVPGTCALKRNTLSISCGECLPGFYATEGGYCLPCGDADHIWGPIVFITCCIFFALCHQYVGMKISTRDSLSFVFSFHSFGLFVTTCQIYWNVSKIPAQWPKASIQAMGFLSIFELDLDSLFRFSCSLGGVNPIQQFFTKSAILPYLLINCIAAHVVICRMMGISRNFVRFWSSIGMLFFTLFATCVLPR